MYIFKRIIGFLMLATPFGAAFYFTYRIAGDKVTFAIWGCAFAALIYFLIAIILLFAQPKVTEPDYIEEIDMLNQKISDLELLYIGLNNRVPLSSKDKIANWRLLNPDGTKSACADDLGLSMTTIYRYWEDKDEK